MHSYDALSDLHAIAQREANGCVGLLLQVVQRGIWQSAQTHCFVLCSFRVAGVNSSSGLSSVQTLQVYIGRFTWLSSCGAHIVRSIKWLGMPVLSPTRSSGRSCRED